MRFCGATTLNLDIQYNDTQYDNKKFSAWMTTCINIDLH